MCDVCHRDTQGTHSGYRYHHLLDTVDNTLDITVDICVTAHLYLADTKLGSSGFISALESRLWSWRLPVTVLC